VNPGTAAPSRPGHHPSNRGQAEDPCADGFRPIRRRWAVATVSAVINFGSRHGLCRTDLPWRPGRRDHRRQPYQASPRAERSTAERANDIDPPGCSTPDRRILMQFQDTFS